MSHTRGLPEPVGVFHRVTKPCYEDMLTTQIDKAIEQRGEGSLEKLIHSGSTWTVAE